MSTGQGYNHKSLMTAVIRYKRGVYQQLTTWLHYILHVNTNRNENRRYHSGPGLCYLAFLEHNEQNCIPLHFSDNRGNETKFFLIDVKWDVCFGSTLYLRGWWCKPFLTIIICHSVKSVYSWERGSRQK